MAAPPSLPTPALYRIVYTIHARKIIIYHFYVVSFIILLAPSSHLGGATPTLRQKLSAMPGRPICENGHCMIEIGARYGGVPGALGGLLVEHLLLARAGARSMDRMSRVELLIARIATCSDF